MNAIFLIPICVLMLFFAGPIFDVDLVPIEPMDSNLRIFGQFFIAVFGLVGLWAVFWDVYGAFHHSYDLKVDSDGVDAGPRYSNRKIPWANISDVKISGVRSGVEFRICLLESTKYFYGLFRTKNLVYVHSALLIEAEKIAEMERVETLIRRNLPSHENNLINNAL